MRILHEQPPMFAEIDAAFHVRGRPVLFCWGDKIYNPENAALTYELGAHEAVHSHRQGDTDESIRAWWRRYIDEPKFRFDEELPAHRAEWRAFCEKNKGVEARRRYLLNISLRLSGPLYGSLASRIEAKRLITAPEPA